MNLRNVPVKREYRPEDDIVRNFYIPMLSAAISYKRAVGFFSSSILAEIAVGISALVQNHGKIQIVASPYLSDDDINAIKTGYKMRDEVVKQSILSALDKPTTISESKNLNLLANLIADNILDIKIAFTEKGDTYGMYHEKMGIISDYQNNHVAFAGSLNETLNAVHFNYETIDVFCSWKDEDVSRVNDKMSAFERIWNNSEPNITIVPFPELKDEIINRYKKSKVDYTDTKNWTIETSDNNTQIDMPMFYPKVPSWLTEIRPYQTKAVERWHENGYRGIFDMATGTGKTLTGLLALTDLAKSLNNNLAAIIVVPYQHLVDQWVEDITEFNVRPIIGYSASPQKDWFKKLDRAIFNQKLKVKGCNFFLFICTNATFATERVQKLLQQISGETLIMIDEAHNAGAAKFTALLKDNYTYRLALSATIDRHGDPEGTQKLFNFFGEKCIEYPLDEAIRAKMLTRYHYYPVIVTLEEDELDLYTDLSREIGKCLIVQKNGKLGLNEKGKRLAIARARIVAGARNKLSSLEREITPFIHDNNILVYCGATNLLPDGSDVSETNTEDLRQIKAVSALLGNKLGMRTARFTSEENMDERKIIKREFEEGDLQALVAIKCLDEGVNIPAIRTAFILASTTNPKEYIQRRGRVLRKYKNKDFAEIYDFITLPRPINKTHYLTDQQRRFELSLVKNELQRAEEFARIADNQPEAVQIINEIKDAYSINEYLVLDLDEEFTDV